MQQHVEDIRVGFFYLVEEYDAVWPAAHGFSQLPAFIVAHIAWRRADEARDAVLLHVFAHVDTYHGGFIIEEELGQGFGQLGLAHAGGTQEDEGAQRAVFILKAGAGAAHGIGHGFDCFFLPDEALAEAFFHVQELFALAFGHAGGGDAGPGGDNLGDIRLGHFLFEQAGAALLQGCQGGAGILGGVFCCRDFAVEYG